MNKPNDQRNTRWLLAAMAAPVTQAASNCSWIVALSVGVLCLGITEGLSALGIGTVRSRLLCGIQWLWMLLVTSEFLHWIMLCWPNHSDYRVVPLVILALAALSLAKGEEKSAMVGSVLRYVLIILLGAVLFSGIKAIKLENIGIQWKMQTAYYVMVMLLPAVTVGTGTRSAKLGVLLYAVTVAVITSGVMSLEKIEEMKAPFYEMSRSISLLGIGQRFETLVAAGMTMGYFVLTSYLLNTSAKAWERGRRRRRIWISAGFIGLVFLSGMRMNSRLLALGMIAVWVVLPILEKMIKTVKFPLDKKRKRW